MTHPHPATTLRHHTHPTWGQTRRAQWGQIKLMG